MNKTKELRVHKQISNVSHDCMGDRFTTYIVENNSDGGDELIKEIDKLIEIIWYKYR